MAIGPYELSTIERIADVDEASWDALVGTDNPFVEHRFLRALEEAGCLDEESGWLPSYTLVRD